MEAETHEFWAGVSCEDEILIRVEIVLGFGVMESVVNF